MRTLRIILILCTGILLVRADSAAQEASSGSGVVQLRDWPHALRQNEAANDTEDLLYPYDLLPFIDTLSLDYAYFVEGQQPVMQYALTWSPGSYGILDNEKVLFEELPGNIHIVAVELQTQIYVEDRPVTTLRIVIDSLMLASAPEHYAFTWEDRSWNSIFVDTPEETARTLFATGFSMRDLEIKRMAFAAYEASIEVASYDPRYPDVVSLYPPDIDIIIDWIFWPTRPGAGKGGPSTTKPQRKPREGIGRNTPAPSGRTRTRGDTTRNTDEGESRTGRTDTGDRDKTSAGRDSGPSKKQSSRSGKKKDDDDDDDASLVPAALVGVAAIGLVAFAGGTVGYYGNVSETPIGLTSGFVRPEGGFMLQVAINEGVISSGNQRGKLIAKVTSFYDVFKVPVQPALGLGVLAEEAGDDIDLSPSVSVGVVGNLGSFVLYGGYDLTARGVDIGLAYNFRSKPRPVAR